MAEFLKTPCCGGLKQVLSFGEEAGTKEPHDSSGCKKEQRQTPHILLRKIPCLSLEEVNDDGIEVEVEEDDLMPWEPNIGVEVQEEDLIPCLSLEEANDDRIEEVEKDEEEDDLLILEEANDDGMEDEKDDDTLIPGLPIAVTLHCLARLPRWLYPQLRSVSKSWLKALSSNSGDILSVRQELQCTEAWVYLSFSSNCRLGNSFEAFDPGSNAWRNIGLMPGLQEGELLKGYGSVGLGGKLYIVGGKLCHKTRHPASEIDLGVRREVYVYDCIGETWKQCASMGTARVDFACSVAHGCIYVSGGRSRLDHEKGMSNAEIYIPELDEWRALPEMRVARYKCVGVTLNGKVYVIGGYTDSAWDRSSVEIFDPAVERWKFVQGMWPLDIPPYQVMELQGQLYRSGDQLNPWRGSIDLYDESLNLWKTMKGSRRRLDEDLQGSLRQRYVTITGIGKHLLFFAGHCNVGEHGPFCFETVDAFDPEDGEWSRKDPCQCSNCRELCSPCCVVYA